MANDTFEDWEFENDKEKAKFEEPVTKKNCGAKLRLIRKLLGISRRELARILEVSESTVGRLEEGTTLATDEFMNLINTLCAIGPTKFAKLSATDKKKGSEIFGTSGGVVTGASGSIAAIGAAGIPGYSAAGITSGLATIGGGTMLGGIAVVAIIPVLAGVGGYGLVKGIKRICKEINLSCDEVDERWEIRRKNIEEN